MKKELLSTLIISLIVTISGCSTNNFNSPPDNIKNNVIKENVESSLAKTLVIRFNSNVNQQQINKLNSDIGINSFNTISNELKIVKIQTKSQTELNIIKQKYIASDLVKYAEQDAKLSLFPYTIVANSQANFSVKADGARPNDSFYGLQWNAQSIDADKAWTITTGDPKIVVAVIDSGVDPDHPDLINNLLPLIDMLDDSGQPDTYVNAGINVDYAGRDGNGHGTHVTGILAASINNGKGIAGIAGNVKILPIKAADHEGNTSASIIAKSILKAIEKGVRVINLSIGGPPSEGTQALQDAVDLAISKGIVFVSATGNESNRSASFIEKVTVPAAYPGVISVAATTVYDKVANYSNGGTEVEISAPGGGGKSSEGEKIYSTWPTYKTFEGYRANISGPYTTLSGTSMSCPHVSAVAALILSREPNLTGQQVRVRLLSTTTNIDGANYDQDTGYGKLNAYNALVNNTNDKKIRN
ncbi:MAG: S8 family serine peptidase [Candidatus Sericytochromatia bacterium]|nr:S8 family serine peptidase [Candidatus Sericytochromatia bacterium]